MTANPPAFSPLAEGESLFYKDSTHEIVSAVAYLAGVPKRIFENEYEPPKLESYQRLEQDKNARIIRNLCQVRTAIQRNFRAINEKMRTEYKSLFTLPEYVPSECINQLSADGISFVKKSSIRLAQHIVEINRILTDRINNCKHLFPLWINWNYIREMFLMPDGLSEAGTKAASQLYYANLSYYPYQVYLNWVPSDKGNILYNDKKFVTLLYQEHEDAFQDYHLVTDAGTGVKRGIYDFLDESRRTVVVVDCENSDPYKLCATLNGLEPDRLEKISKVILFDDVHTVDAWRVLESHTPLPVEHVMIERIKQNKSLVDIRLATGVCHEFYRSQADSFILVSSDSDYWGLISSLPEARFLVMVEHDKCGPDMKAALQKSSIFYCYIDDFYTGGLEELKREVLFKEISARLDKIDINAYTLLADALRAARMEMTPTEQQRFYEKHLRQMSLRVAEDGKVIFELKKK